jgi:PKD repeat protein
MDCFKRLLIKLRFMKKIATSLFLIVLSICSYGQNLQALINFGPNLTSNSYSFNNSATCGNPQYTFYSIPATGVSNPSSNSGQINLPNTAVIYTVVVQDANGASNSATMLFSPFSNTPNNCKGGFIPNPTSSPYTFDFTNLSKPNTDALIWLWGDGTSTATAANITTVTKTYTNQGVYHPRVVSIDTNFFGNWCQDTSAYGQVTVYQCTSVNNNCNAAFIDTFVNSGVYFINQSTTANGGTTSNNYWTFGDGTTSNQSNPFHTYANPGAYNVCLVIKDSTSAGVCVDSFCQTIVVPGSAPTCNANFTYSINPNGVYLFTNTSNNTSASYIWDFGDGTTSTQNNPSHYYPNNGIYNVCLYMYSAANVLCDSFCNTIIVNTSAPTPCNASMTYTSNGCQGVFVNTSATGYNSAVWYFGDGTSASNINSTVSHTYPATGVYYPYLVLSYPGLNGAICTDTSSLGQLYVNCGTAANCNALFTSTNFANGNVTYTNASTYAVITGLSLWNFGDGTTAYSNGNINHTYTSNGAYQVCLYILDSFTNIICDSVCNSVVITNINPTTCNASMTYTSNGCQGVFVNTSLAGYINALWVWGDGTSTINNNPTVIHTYPSSGVYYPYLVISYANPAGGVCIDTSALGQLSISCSTSVCNASFVSGNAPNGVVTFSNTSSNAAFYQWTFGDGTTSNAVNPIHTYTANGVFNVCLYLYNNNQMVCDSQCSSIAVTNVPFINNCNATLTGYYDTSICQGVLDISASGMVTNIVWQFGDGTSANGNSLMTTHNYLNNGVYTANAIVTMVDSNGTTCIDSTNYMIIYAFCPSSPACNASFTYGNNPAGGINFNNTSTAASTATYLWFFGDGNSSSLANPLHAYSVAGSYNVCLVLYDQTNNCIDSFCNIVTYSAPQSCVANYTYSPSGNTISFTNSSTSNSLFTSAWYFGNGITSTQTNPIYTYPTPGTYNVCLVIINNNCIDSMCQTIVVGSNVCNADFTANVTGCNATLTNTSTGPYSGGVWLHSDLTTAVMSSTSNQIVTKNYPGNGVYTECLAIYAAGANCLDTVCKPVVIFNCTTNSVNSIALISAISVYPNPTPSNVTLNIDALKSEKAHVQINDALGRLVYETPLNLNSGKNEFKLPTSNLASSMYWIKVVDGHGNVKMLKFQKQ